MERHILASAAAGLVLLGGATACTGHSGNATGPVPQANEATLVNQGVSLTEAGKYDEANTIFRQVVAANPSNKWAWFDLGYICQARNDAATAMADYDKALAVDPNYIPPLFNKAMLLEKSNVDGAIDLYRKVLTIDSRQSTTHMRLGRLLDQQGDRVDARNEFEAAVAIDASLSSAVPQAYRSGS